jgi:hypothetical protein
VTAVSTDATISRDAVEQAISAVLYGTVGHGAPTYTGVSKDEALEYAAVLAQLAQRVLSVLDHDYSYIGLSCFTDDQHAAGVMAAASIRTAFKRDLGVSP